VIKTAAFLLIVSLAAGSARSIVCAIDCRDLGTLRQATTCHDDEREPSDTLGVIDAHHNCDHDFDVALLAAPITGASFATAFELLLPLVASTSTSPRTHEAAGPASLARPPGAVTLPAFFVPTILRI
jgi:hypothetical protein